MFRRINRYSRSDLEEENPFMLSISDLMAALLAVFVLSVVLMMIQLERKRKELEIDRERIEITRIELVNSLKQIQETHIQIGKAIQQVTTRERNLAEMLGGMQRELADRGIMVGLAENDTVLRIKEDELSFALGSHKIPVESVIIVNTIGDVLLKWLSPDERRVGLDTVFLEGHSDSVKNYKEMGNWGLSAYRAISLWRHWTETPGNFALLSNLTNASKRPLFSVSGYSDTRPIELVSAESLNSLEGSSKDRRIDIRFTLVAVDEKPLSEIQTKLEESESVLKNIIENLSEPTTR